MENEGNTIIPIIGYVIGFLIPIIGLIYGTILFYYKKEVPLYRKHGRYIIYFSIAIFVINFVIKLLIWEF